jgi:hypothetical protein
MITEETTIPAEVQEELNRAAVQMSRAKTLIDEGEAIKASVKESILPVMQSFGIVTSHCPEVGKLNSRSGGGSSIDGTKLAVELLAEGIDADRIPGIIERSTKSWTYSYIEFKAEKKG